MLKFDFQQLISSNMKLQLKNVETEYKNTAVKVTFHANG